MAVTHDDFDDSNGKSKHETTDERIDCWKDSEIKHLKKELAKSKKNLKNIKEQCCERCNCKEDCNYYA